MINDRPFKLMYYAHCMDIYGTVQESRDIDTILQLGYLAEDPNSTYNKEQFEKMRAGLAPHEAT